MPDDIPTYLWGDTIRLRAEVEHRGNLGDAWANFTREEEEGIANRPSFGLSALEINEIRRVEGRTVSLVVFEEVASRTQHPIGVYKLSNLRGLPIGASRTQDAGATWDLGPPPRDVRLRIEGPPEEQEAEVKHVQLERPANEQRFYNR